MKKEFIITEDGSHTLYLPELGEQYHSTHGAIQESTHVYIETGLLALCSSGVEEISIFEMGFGTGLNAILTFIECRKRNISVNYYAIEPFPLSLDEACQLNYIELLQMDDLKRIFEEMHSVPFGETVQISEGFCFTKEKTKLSDFKTDKEFDLIYFDAFAPSIQPELWTEEVFNMIFSITRKNGLLTTYSAKGSVRRALKSAGYNVERLPGPPGKREILRAKKCDF